MTITKLPNGAKGITEFEKLTVSPKPRVEGWGSSAPAKKDKGFYNIVIMFVSFYMQILQKVIY